MEKILKKKKIDTLYHFTRCENLEKIFRYGLLPRSVLDKKKIDSYYNDEYRYDGCLDAVCLSIEFPNYKMFYRLRMENPNTEWAVIKLNARLLCDSTCAYCWTNAGDQSMVSISLEERMKKKTFLDLFENKKGYPKREELGLEDWYPTNPQAEVLVFDKIDVAYIEAVLFDDQKVLNKYFKCIHPNVQADVDVSVFKYRKDYTHWR